MSLIAKAHRAHAGYLMVVAVLVVTVTLATVAVPAQAGDWQGKVEKVDGVEYVRNPATPTQGSTTVNMEALWELGGDTDDEDQFFGVISDIHIDPEGNVYLLDAQLSEVKIFTADGEFVRTIGREGEGPGEFRRPSRMFFTADGNVGVMQTIPAKIVLLTPMGDPVGEHPLPAPEDGGFQMLTSGQASNGQLVLAMARTKLADDQSSWSRTDFLTRIDPQGKELAEYTQKTTKINFADAVLNFAEWDTFERRWTVAPDGKVYAAESYDDYVITVYNADGSVDKKITRDYKHRAYTADEKQFLTKMMEHFAQTIPNCRVEVENNAKDIETFYIRDDGSIWVLSSDGSHDYPDDAVGTFDVYNKDGQFVKMVTLNGDGDAQDDYYLFVKDRFYVVTDFLQAAMVAQGATGLYDDEEEAEPMAVRCYKLEGDLLSAR
ncbi:MAG: 6-bladed beta-propeller [Candidatus Latescibacterota bacterium]|jgi:hypothetical protein